MSIVVNNHLKAININNDVLFNTVIDCKTNAMKKSKQVWNKRKGRIYYTDGVLPKRRISFGRNFFLLKILLKLN